MDLNLNPEVIKAIIDRAREFHVKEEVSFPERPHVNPEEFDPMQYLADHKDDLTYREVVTEINALEPDQQTTLVALLYLGRGDYSIDEWNEALAEAKNNWAEHTGEYLMGHPLLADYLEEALMMHGYVPSELDTE